MQAAGLQLPFAAPPLAAVPRPVSVGGVVTLQSVASMMQAEQRVRDAQLQQQQASTLIQSLAGHIKDFWTMARTAKEQGAEKSMLDAVRARRGEYSPEMLTQLRQQNSSTIYMMLFSTKARQASSLLRDILLGTGTEKPWTLRPSPVPELPVSEVSAIMQAVSQEVFEAEQMGILASVAQIKERLRDARQQLENRLMEEARIRAERMEKKMEDQLDEGGFLDALDQFIDDLTTFKTSFIKGPIVRRKACLKWGPNDQLNVVEEFKLEWERVDPFNIYPAPWARCLQSAPFIERHKLDRAELESFIGVEGYNEDAIRRVLDEYGTGGLRDWLTIDSAKAAAEGRNDYYATTNSRLIDALQYWGSVSGKLLRQWGMTAEQVPDEAKEYQVECWLIGNYVIKAVLNPDALGRRPYYGDSYERVPGSFWGNSLYDLVRDCEDMCNAAARSLVNNMGIASGPQVGVNVDRLPAGENITTMFPWKLWQFTSDPMGSTAKAIEFFQPQSNAAELMAVYKEFSQLADEYSGIPKYMAGFSEGSGGAGRTASGMSMMIGNASKIIKQVVTGIDLRITKPILERLYYHNMRYGEDPDLKGDVYVVTRGAMSLQVKEAAQVRRNEFLAATANPIDMQIIGMEGRAEVLRETVKGLDMNTDKVVPPLSVLRQRAAMQAAMQQAAQPQPQAGGGQQLTNGAPVIDNFQPA